MTEITTALPVATITPAQAKTKISIALTKAEIVLNTMQKQAAEIVVNEDHLEETKTLLDKFVRARSLVDAAHRKEKEPYLQGGKAIDTAKNETLIQILAIEDPLRLKYNKVCGDVVERKRVAEEEEAKNKAILSGIDANVMEFSQRIAQCATTQELTIIERNIGAQKTATSKYGKHLQTAIEKFEALKPLITAQKIKITELESVKAKISIAEEEGDIDKLEELTVKKENVEQEIQYNQTKVQDDAINSASSASGVTQVFASVPKGGRTEYEIEIVDLNVALKKSSNLLNIELKLAEAKKNAKLLDDADMFKGTSVAVVNGIKYTKIKKY